MSALLNRKELHDRLTNNIVDLYFTKVDGTKRRMKATLMESITRVAPTSIPLRSQSDTTGNFTVYDVDKSDWRTFKIDRVSTVITPSLGECVSDGTDVLR